MTKTTHLKQIHVITGLFLLMLCCSMPLLALEKPRYCFTNLSEIQLPLGSFGFFPHALNEKGEVYGELDTDESFLDAEIAVYKQGKIEIVKSSNNQLFPITVNKKNTVLATQFEPVFENGEVIDFIFQNVFSRNGQVETLPDPLTPTSVGAGEVDLNGRDQVLFFPFFFVHEFSLLSNGIMSTGVINLPPEMFVFLITE